MKPLKLTGASLTLEHIEEVARFFRSVKVSKEAVKNINKSREFIEKKFHEDKFYYGINTGFGDLCNVKVPGKDVKKLQVNLIRSHAVGVGELLSEEVVRAAMLIRINTLIQGNSGVRLKVIQLLVDFLNKKIHPCIPSQGSVGASGDLAPLAHMSLALIGEGEVFFEGEKMSSIQALKKAKLEKIELYSKEGLALINGTAVMCAVGTLTLLDAERLAKMADISGAMSLEALKGSDTAFSADLHLLKPHPGQAASAKNIKKLMKGSEIRESHKECGKVQDAYSLRCMPQVHGASRDAIAYTRKVLEIEVNSVTDNPLIIPDKEEIILGGNFHGQPVALAMDFLGIAIAELADIAERRIARLVNSRYSELPPFLIENNGLNSGFMVAQYTAAALVSENKVLAHPASVDSIPTCAGQEDHVSMGTIAARKARSILQNAWQVIAIEFMSAAQGLDFLQPLIPGKALYNVWKTIRNKVKKLKNDRRLDIDIQKIVSLMREGVIVRSAEKIINSLE